MTQILWIKTDTKYIKPFADFMFLREITMKLKPGKYKHYKGKEYEVIGIARHSETLEELVVYKALYQTEGRNLWVRPLKMFAENIMINGKETPRFKYLGE